MLYVAAFIRVKTRHFSEENNSRVLNLLRHTVTTKGQKVIYNLTLMHKHTQRLVLTMQSAS
jgi:hypothetical protein